MPKRIVAIKVDYTTNPAIDAARYEPEQSFYWAARLNDHKPSLEYIVRSIRSPYVDDQGHPLFFVQINHKPSNKVLYVRNCAIIEGK